MAIFTLCADMWPQQSPETKRSSIYLSLDRGRDTHFANTSIVVREAKRISSSVTTIVTQKIWPSWWWWWRRQGSAASCSCPINNCTNGKRQPPSSACFPLLHVSGHGSFVIIARKITYLTCPYNKHRKQPSRVTLVAENGVDINSPCVTLN